MPNPTKAELVAYATERAVEAKLSPTKVIQVINCETAGTWDPKIQSRAKYKNGKQEQSFGLVQIHLPAHPNVSYEEATDPYYAIDFLIDHWKKGNQWMWSCY